MVRKIRYSKLGILAVLVFVEAVQASSPTLTTSTPTADSTKPTSFLPEKKSTESSTAEKNNSTTIPRTVNTTESTNDTRGGTASELLPSEDKTSEASVSPTTPQSSSTIESTSSLATPATMNNATTMKIEGTKSSAVSKTAAPSIIPTTRSANASESIAESKSHSSTTVSPDSTVESPSDAPTKIISHDSRSGKNSSTTTLANPSSKSTMYPSGLGSSTSSSLAGNHKTIESHSGKSNNATDLPIVASTPQRSLVIPSTGSVSTTASPSSIVESSLSTTETISQDSSSGKNSSITTLVNTSSNSTMSTPGLGSATSSYLAGNRKTTESHSGKSKNATDFPIDTSTTRRTIVILSTESVSTTASPSSTVESPSLSTTETISQDSSSRKSSSATTLANISSNSTMSTPGLGSSTSSPLVGNHKTTESQSGKSNNATDLSIVTSTTEPTTVISPTEGVSTPASPISIVQSTSFASSETIGHDSSSGINASITTSTSSSLATKPKTTGFRSGKSKDPTDLPIVTSTPQQTILTPTTEGVPIIASITTPLTLYNVIPELSVMRENEVPRATELGRSGAQDFPDAKPTTRVHNYTVTVATAIPGTTVKPAGDVIVVIPTPSTIVEMITIVSTTSMNKKMTTDSASRVAEAEMDAATESNRPKIQSVGNATTRAIVSTASSVIEPTENSTLAWRSKSNAPVTSKTIGSRSSTIASADHTIAIADVTMASPANTSGSLASPTSVNDTITSSTNKSATVSSPTSTSVTTASPISTSVIPASRTNTSVTTARATNTSVTTASSTNKSVTMISPTQTSVTVSSATNTSLSTANLTNTSVTMSSPANTNATSPTNTSLTTVNPTNISVTMSNPTNTNATTTSPTYTSLTTANSINTSVTMSSPTNTKATTTSPTNTSLITANPTTTSVTMSIPTNTKATTISPTNTSLTMTNPTNTSVTMSSPTNTNANTTSPTNTSLTTANPTDSSTTMASSTNISITTTSPTNTKTTMPNLKDTSVTMPRLTKTSPISNTPTPAIPYNSSMESTITEATIIVGSTNESSNSVSTTLSSSKFDYIVIDRATGVPCMLSTMSISMKIIYEKTDSTLGEGSLTVPKSARSNGTCNNQTSHMELAWSASRDRNGNVMSGCLNTLLFKFVKNGSISTLDSIFFIVCLDERSFPQAANNRLTVNTTKPLGLFAVTANSGHYVCDMVTNITTGTIRTIITNVSLIAFNQENNISSKREENCVAKAGVNKTVVMGGIAVALIVVSAASVYSWRRRSSSYDSSTLP